MKKSDLLARIVELEARIAKIEAQPRYYYYPYPYFVQSHPCVGSQTVATGTAPYSWNTGEVTSSTTAFALGAASANGF